MTTFNHVKRAQYLATIGCLAATFAVPALLWALAPTTPLWAPAAIVTPFLTMALLERLLSRRPDGDKPRVRVNQRQVRAGLGLPAASAQCSA